MQPLQTHNPFGGRRAYLQTEGANAETLFRNPVKWKPQVTDTYHTVKPNETLERIAYQYYNKLVANGLNYWWLIADANNIFNPLDLSEYVGKELLIPDVRRLAFVEG